MVYLALWILLIASQAAWGQQDKFFDYFRSFNGTKIADNGVFLEKAPSLREIQNELPKISSDADFLNFLVTKYPQIKRNYILVHNSESQQLSSLTHPRIILFGGGTAFAFSESPLQRERRVEILLTDSKTFKTELHEITFHEGKAKLESNPQSCLACHGSPSRALWNPYDFWPNAYGSAIGSVGTNQEMQAYQKLYQSASQSPLLSKLKLPQTYNLDTESISAFTIYVNGLNQGRWIAQHLKKGSAFDKFAKPFLAVTGKCVGDRSVPYSSQPSLEKMKAYLKNTDFEKSLPALEAMIKDQVEARNHFKNFLDLQLDQIYQTPDYVFKVDHTRLGDEALWLAYMRWIFSLSGIDSRDLSSSLFGNDALMSSPGEFMAEFTTALYELRPDLFKDFKFTVHAFAQRPSGRNSTVVLPDCASLLKAVSRAGRVESQEAHFVSYKEDAGNRPVLSRCSKCHSEGLGNSYVDVPFIPFNNPKTLAALLRAPDSQLRDKIERRVRSTGNDQMPPVGHLSEEEIQALLSFLDNLK